MRENSTIREVEFQLEKYYEGKTTNAEEKRLCDFLSQKDIPEQFEADRALLGYFAGKKQKPKTILIPFMKWASIAAVFIGLILFTKTGVKENTESYAYINGEKITNTQAVKEQALASLENISDSPDEVENSIRNLNNKDLIQVQLQLFPEIN